jgi:hypothetical protein
LLCELGQNLFMRGVAFARIVGPLRVEERECDGFFGCLMAADEKYGYAREHADGACTRDRTGEPAPSRSA